MALPQAKPPTSENNYLNNMTYDNVESPQLSIASQNPVLAQMQQRRQEEEAKKIARLKTEGLTDEQIATKLSEVEPSLVDEARETSPLLQYLADTSVEPQALPDAKIKRQPYSLRQSQLTDHNNWLCMGQALDQIKALGYRVGDTVPIRLFPAKGTPESVLKNRYFARAKNYDLELLPDNRYKLIPYTWQYEYTDSQGNKHGKYFKDYSKATSNWWKELRFQNTKGYGVYLIPNKGGHSDKDTTHWQNAFFEVDDKSLEQQQALVNDFAAKTSIEPSVVVRTRKSLHVYYRLHESEWQLPNWTDEVAKPAIYAMDSDPSIHSNAQVMRLAGFYHVKWDKLINDFDYLLCDLQVCKPERQYTRAVICQALTQYAGGEYSKDRAELAKKVSDANAGELASQDESYNLLPKRHQVVECPEELFPELKRRTKVYIDLLTTELNGNLVDPTEAWTKPLDELASHQTQNLNWNDDDEENDILRWAQYLYGFDPEGRDGWMTGQDPTIPEDERDEHSLNSLHIHKESGRFKCHRGTDGSKVYRALRALAFRSNPDEERIYKEKCRRLAIKARQAEGELTKEEYEALNLKPEKTAEDENEAAQLKQAKYDALQSEYDEHLKRLAINPSKVNKYYTCNERYLSDETVAQFPTIHECAHKGQMLALKAPKGTGKSTRIKELINQAKKECWLIISVTPRVNLGIAQSADWGIPWISDDNFEQFIQGNANNMSCCWDSLHKLYRRDYRDKKILFIVDEIESGLEHLSTSGTFKGKGTRAAVYNQLRRLFSHIQQHGGLIIGADADLSRIPLDFIQDVNPGLPITVIDNTYVATKSEVIVYYGKDGDVKSAIKEEVECLNPFICACDSKQDVQDLYDHAVKSVKGDVNQKFWAIHADNINDPENQKRIKDFNGRLKEERPLGVFFSPTITVGISIDVPYFSAGFAIFKGSVTTDVARQMVARNREFVEWVTFADNLCDRKSESTPTTPEEVRAKLLQQIKDQANLCEWATEKILKDDRTGFADDEERLRAELELIQTLKTNVRGLETAEFSLLADVLARQNFQKKHYHQSFVKGMESEGWKVVSKKGNKTSFSDELKEKRELRQKKEAEAIVSADHTLIPDAETAQQILNTSHDKTQRLAAEKVVTAEKACTTPDKLDAELTALIKFNPRFRSGVFLEWYLRNHTAAIRRDGAKMAKMVKDLWAYDTHSAIDAIGNSVWINEVIKLGIFDIIDLDGEGKSYKKSDFQPIIDKLKFLSNSKLEMWAQRIDINWNKKTHKRGGLLNNPIGRIIQPILAKLGYSFTQVKKNKKGQNSYAIPAEEINDIYRANIKLALDKKEAERLATAEFQEAEQQGLILKLDGSSSALKKLEVGTVFA